MKQKLKHRIHFHSVGLTKEHILFGIISVFVQKITLWLRRWVCTVSTCTAKRFLCCPGVVTTALMVHLPLKKTKESKRWKKKNASVLVCVQTPEN